MDDAKLKQILQDTDVPEADPNAQKRAVNVSVQAFKEHQQKKQKKFQGFSILSRLMGNSNSENGRDPMEQLSNKRLIQGGAVLMAGVTFIALPMAYNQTQDKVAEMSYVTAAPDITNAPGTETAAPSYVKAIEKMREDDGHRAISKDKSNTTVLADALGPKEKKAEMRVENEAFAVSPAPTGGALMQGVLGFASPPQQAMKRMVAPLKQTRKRIAMPMPSDDSAPSYYQDEGRDKFEAFEVNPFKQVAAEPVSTFSVDVDTASYSFMRRQLNNGQLPQKDAVRIEELVNYFDYNYALPKSKSEPFKPTVTLTDSPWAEGKKLMHVGIKGYEMNDVQPDSNLVFLLDVSGSMNSPDKLPLLKNSMKLLLDTLKPDDTVSIVTYASGTGVALGPTKVSDQSKIMGALNNLRSGGGTAGAAGINLAYDMAEQNFNDEAVNRVILATDGDFNVGIRDHEELKNFVKRKRKTGIFLSVLGFGQGNYNDQMMQALAQNGNGVAAYIDSLSEARKVLVEEATSSLFPIAKDVKIQVEFNPEAVAEYRLVGYETRALNREDFNNDKVDAGDIGAGHTVSAIYEITPVGSGAGSVDPLRYSTAKNVEDAKADTDFSGELAFLKIRYKLPQENKSKLIAMPVTSNLEGTAGTEQNFATAVAGFGQLLQGGEHVSEDFTYDDVIALAKRNKGEDDFGYRAEFINLVRLAKSADR